MKALVCCCVALFATAHCGTIAATGSSSQYRSEDGFGNYNFGYDEAHATGGSFRRESGNSVGTKAGSYGLRDIDGRVRVVNYVADGQGYRAAISTNEPGTAPSAPAASSYSAVASDTVLAATASHVAPAAVAAPIYGVAYNNVVAPYAVAKTIPYSSAINHAVVHSAPSASAAYNVPVARYVATSVPVTKAIAYSSAVNHGIAHSAPVVYAGHVAAPIAYAGHVAAPVAYTGHVAHAIAAH